MTKENVMMKIQLETTVFTELDLLYHKTSVALIYIYNTMISTHACTHTYVFNTSYTIGADGSKLIFR